jgi:hypothetical protein
VFSDDQLHIYQGVNIAGGALEGPWPGELHGTFEHDWSLRGPYNLIDLFEQLSHQLSPGGQ